MHRASTSIPTQSQNPLKLRGLVRRRSGIKLLSILLKPNNHPLPLRTNNPPRKAIRHTLILRPLPNKHMSRVQQRITRHIRRRLIDGRLVLQLPINRQERAPIRNRILIQQNRRRQRLDRIRNVLVVPGGVRRGPGDLSDLDPQLGILDVGSGLVVAREEAHGRLGLRLRGGVDGREHGFDVHVLGEAGRVGGRADEEEVVAPGVPGGGFGDALLYGDLLRGRRVGDADVDRVGFEVVD